LISAPKLSKYWTTSLCPFSDATNNETEEIIHIREAWEE
jgi:hypothetical protein